MGKLNNRLVDSLEFTVPPECGGQMVTYSYAYKDGKIYEKISDRSDLSKKIVVYEDSDEETFEPWNGTPETGDEIATYNWIEEKKVWRDENDTEEAEEEEPQNLYATTSKQMSLARQLRGIAHTIK